MRKIIIHTRGFNISDYAIYIDKIKEDGLYVVKNGVYELSIHCKVNKKSITYTLGCRVVK